MLVRGGNELQDRSQKFEICIKIWSSHGFSDHTDKRETGGVDMRLFKLDFCKSYLYFNLEPLP